MFQNLDKNLVTEAEAILEDIGMDIDTAIRMTLKKIVRENSVAFLLSDKPARPVPEKAAPSRTEPEPKMTKSRAAALFQKEGIRVSHNTTFSSKNKTTQIYWSNPNRAVLSENWYLILHDWVHRELHLFFVPENAVSPDALKYRADNHALIDLQIAPDDPTFTDNRSKMSFADFLVKSIRY